MKSPNVCTEPSTHGRIVSSNLQPLGGSTSSRNSVLSPQSSVLIPPGASTSLRRIRREENHFISAVGTNYHLCAGTRYGSKMFTLHSQTVDLTLINLFYPFSRTILERSESPAHSSYKPIIEPRKRYPVVKAVIVPKSEWAVVILISLIYSLTKGSSFPIRATFHVEKSLWPSAKTQKSQTSLLCDARSHKSHIKSLNVNGNFITTYSGRSRSNQNPKNCQNKKSLNVTDSEPKPLIYSLTAASSFYSVLSLVAVCKDPSVQWPYAKTHQSFRLSFVLFGFFAVNPLLKSAFRNLVCAHETPVYRRLLEIIGFEISPNFEQDRRFASPRGRGQGEGELSPCSTEPYFPIKNQKSKIKNVYPALDYRALSRIIGFEFSPNALYV
jgi:hypothetical protein